LKVRSERVMARNEDEQEAERERMRMRRAYERDGNWIPGTLN
jgi:hypothetical protein